MVCTSFPEIRCRAYVAVANGRLWHLLTICPETYRARQLWGELQRFGHGSANGGNRRIPFSNGSMGSGSF